jgi:hypothetical protein
MLLTRSLQSHEHLQPIASAHRRQVRHDRNGGGSGTAFGHDGNSRFRSRQVTRNSVCYHCRVADFRRKSLGPGGFSYATSSSNSRQRLFCSLRHLSHRGFSNDSARNGVSYRRLSTTRRRLCSWSPLQACSRKHHDPGSKPDTPWHRSISSTALRCLRSLRSKSLSLQSKIENERTLNHSYA